MTIERDVLERLSALDVMLIQRHGSRDLLRTLRMHSRHKPRYPFTATPSDNVETDNAKGECLGGLHCFFDADWSVTISAGAYLMQNPAPVTEDRPVYFSPPTPDEADDDLWCLAQTIEDTSVTPGDVPGGALADYEYWLISATAALTTVESDPERVVYNEGTKTWDSIAADKVTTHRLEFTVTRSVPGDTPPALPSSAHVPIALLFVPNGATDLSTAEIFDCRRILDPGPNMINGQGLFGFRSTENDAIGQEQGGLTSGVISGSWRARIHGEEVSVFTGETLRIDWLKEPGAAWDNAATSAAPKIAWVYLCKVQGYVPRPMRRGAAMVGGNSDRSPFLSGALVISPTPPVLGIRENTDGESKSAGRWNLHPSTTLTLPSWQASASGGLHYRYGGVVVPASDALCVGFMLYTDLDVPTSTPLIYGPGCIAADGWYSIALTDTAGSSEFATAARMEPVISLLSFEPNGDNINLFINTATHSVIGADYKMPINAVRVTVSVTAASGLGSVWQTYPPYKRHLGQSGIRIDFETEIAISVDSSDVNKASRVEFYTGAAVDPEYLAAIIGVRLPYNEPLAG